MSREGQEEPDDIEEQSALELIWAMRHTPLAPGDLAAPPADPASDEFGPAARGLQREMDERRRQLVELLAHHLGSGALTVPAILSRLSPEERARMNEVLGGRSIAEVLGTTDLFHLGLE